MFAKLVKFGFFGGAVTGLIYSFVFILVWLMGFQPLRNQEFLFMPVFGICYMFFGFMFRTKYNGGYLHAWQGITLMIVANFVTIILFCWFLFFYLDIFNYGMLVEHKEFLINQVQNETQFTEMKPEERATIVEQLKGVTAKDLAMDKFLKMSFFGILIAVLAGVMNRKVK